MRRRVLHSIFIKFSLKLFSLSRLSDSLVASEYDDDDDDDDDDDAFCE